MNLIKLIRIARREYLTNFRRRSFLFTMFGLPIFLVAIFLIIGVVTTSAIDSIDGFKRIGVVDQAGVFPGREIPAPFALYESLSAADAAQKSGEADAYYVIPADYLKTGMVEAYYSQAKALNDGARDALFKAIKGALATRFNNPDIAARLENPVENLTYFRRGVNDAVPEAALTAIFLVPSIVGTLIFMLTMTSSQFLMSGLVEEKENRMMEVFMTSARPIEMMSGKLLGMGLLGLTQLGVWGLFGLAYLLVSGQLGDIGKILAALQLTPIFIFVTLIMTLLGYLFYGSILAGIGATVNAEKEAQQYATLIVLGGVAPLALVIVFLLDPNGGAAQLMSVIPLTAPIALIIRLSLATVPTAHILFSMGVMVVSVIVAIYFSARVFRMGMLNYGKGGVFRILRQAVFGARTPRLVETPSEVRS